MGNHAQLPPPPRQVKKILSPYHAVLCLWTCGLTAPSSAEHTVRGHCAAIVSRAELLLNGLIAAATRPLGALESEAYCTQKNDHTNKD